MRRVFASVIIFALLVAVAPPASAAPAFETVLPDDTIAFVSVRDLPTLQSRFKKHSAYDLWKEPSVQQFFERAIQRLKEEVAKVEGDAGVKLSEVWSLFHGQIALAVSVGENVADPEVILLVDVGTEGERAMQWVDALNDAAIKKGKSPRRTAVEEEYEGVRLIHMHKAPSAEAGAAAAGDPVVSYGVAGEVFIVGRPVAGLKRTISFLKTPPPAALAGASAYTSTLNKISDNSEVIVFANLARILSLVKQKAQNSPVPQILGALGLDGLVSFGVGIELGEEFATSRVFLQNTGTPQGILKLLMPAPGPLHTGAEVPADAAGFVSFRFEPATIWDELEKGLAVAAPQVLAMINMKMNTLAEQLGESFNLRDDILGVFGPRVTVYTRFEKPYELKTPGQFAIGIGISGQSAQQAVILMDITSQSAFEQVLNKLRKLAPQVFAMLQAREYMGHKVYAMTVPTPPNLPPDAGMPPEMPKPAFAVTENQVIFSNHVAALEAHLRRIGQDALALAARPEFQAGLSRLPADNRVMISFQDPTYQAEYLLTVLKDKSFSRELDKLKADPDKAAVLDLFDLSLLPDAADVTKHLVPTTSCAIVDSDGLLIVSQSPLQPARPE